jgi:pre-rRNA-processing protein TSR4
VDDDGSDSDTSSDSLLTALAATTVSESPWKAAPMFPPLYLSTASEYLPPPPKVKAPTTAEVLDEHDDGKKTKDTSWMSEAYEDSLEVDQVFERFTKRVGNEGEQCVR